MEAGFTWIDTSGAGRNRFAIFRRILRCRGAIRAATLHLFVDNRYRLRVNGVIAGYGPVRFVPGFPEYDSIDLTPYLVAGENVLCVEAWSPGANNFQAMRESRAGVCAWGRVESDRIEDLATPGEWRVRAGAAWDGESPAFSFAQGPVEICDLRQLPSGWFTSGGEDGWQAPVAIATPIWGALAPRSIPAPSLTCDRPMRLLMAASLSREELRLVGRVNTFSLVRDGKDRVRVPYAVCIHSTQDQIVELGTFWGPHWINGVELQPSNDPMLGNRQNAQMSLQAGWNLLYGEPEVLADVWGVLVAVPRTAGLMLRSHARDDAAQALAIAAPLPEAVLRQHRGEVPATPADFERLPFTWREQADADVPAREVAWDRTEQALPSAGVTALALAGTPHVLVYDCGTEILGHVVVDLEAPAGTVIDIAVDERLRSDGQLALFSTNPFADTVDRFRSDGTRRRFDSFHPRGGRYVQITLRPPTSPSQPQASQPQSMLVHSLTIRSARVEVQGEGEFSCADPVYTWAWLTGRETLRACVEDAFLDCPWRERGTYLGDALVESNALRASTRDLSVAWRTVALAAQAQQSDGQLMGCVPSWLTGAAGDFTLIWILMLRDLWASSGDTVRLASYWPVVERILASPRWSADADGLWTADGMNLFIDWGAPQAARSGPANGVLNALRIRALDCAAELATAIRRADAHHYAEQAQVVRAAYRRRLWNAERHRFNAGTAEPQLAIDGLHANVLALAFGIGSAAETDDILRFLMPALTANAERALSGGEPFEYLELYYLHYALQGLYRHRLSQLAESLVRDHFLPMQVAGAWTLWEGLRWGARGQGSLCHAWSSAPMWAAHDHILGLRFERAGDPLRLVIAPESHLSWARGRIPHPQGMIDIAWRRNEDVVWLEVLLPAGVTARVEPGAAWSGCRLHQRISSRPAAVAG